MREFKFLTKKQNVNQYLSFDMDQVLLNVIRFKQINNIPILERDTPLQLINVPINGWLKINNWRTIQDAGGEMVEINYSIIEINTTARIFTFVMDLHQFQSYFESLDR